MIVYNISTPNFSRETTCMFTFELIEGDKPALLHIPQCVCELYYSKNVDDALSFVIFDTNTLEDYSFALLKPSNLQERNKGVEIVAIGYNTTESYRDLLAQLKFHASTFKENNQKKYDYIWGKDLILSETMAAYSEGNIACINI